MLMRTNRLSKLICFSFFLLSCSLSSFCQNPILSNNTQVSILTCGTGNESYSLFGHTAIRISDIENNLDLVYNYGAFDFNTPNFVAKFAKGDLQYFAITHPYDNFISQYIYERRAVYEQELNLSLDLKQKLFDNLNASLASGDSYYTYKFIDKNCTSMVVDIINQTLGEKAISKKIDTELTYRTILFPYFDNHFYEQLGTSIIFGPKVDQKGDHIFLPLELMENLKLAKFKNQNLVEKETKTILNFEDNLEHSWWNNWYSYLIILGLIIVLHNRIINQTYFFILGVIGILFVFLGFYSGHLELANNYNILLFNPLFILSFLFYTKKEIQWIYYLTLFNLLLLAIYAVVLINKAHLLIILPLITTNTFLLTKLVLHHKKNVTNIM
ncbi:DUF4105 domain-containing protein [Flavobacterium sp. NG2]|uniref:lipoprotein N-acyltransferase Lnb domain-containing protein n=1 Tax=Flavobacterium sp. NG2 TaxID=3097547 RepID=UPI002A82B23B|nr:DUF4105 domain-containing protein [Flavobacterium sp. NG2]WPR71588.1 DUF4105 domain-containing protein [Flavobacterium sp. NG2]